MPITNDSFQVTMSGLMPSGDRWVNTLACQRTDPGADPDDALTAFDNGYTAVITTNGFHEDTTLDRSTIKNLSTLDVIEHSLSEVGSVSGRAVNNQISEVVSLRTTHAGRSGRGRIFLPPLAETTLGTPIPTPSDSHREALLDDFEAMFDALTAIDFGWAVYSRSDAELYLITSLRIGNVLDTMRSRRSELTETYTSRVIFP